jgi:hypothetical protein
MITFTLKEARLLQEAVGNFLARHARKSVGRSPIEVNAFGSYVEGLPEVLVDLKAEIEIMETNRMALDGSQFVANHDRHGDLWLSIIQYQNVAWALEAFAQTQRDYRDRKRKKPLSDDVCQDLSDQADTAERMAELVEKRQEHLENVTVLHVHDNPHE